MGEAGAGEAGGVVFAGGEGFVGGAALVGRMEARVIMHKSTAALWESVVWVVVMRERIMMISFPMRCR